MADFFVAFEETTGVVISVWQNVDGKKIAIDKTLALELIEGIRTTTEFSVVWENNKFVLKDNAQTKVVEQTQNIANEFYQLPDASADEKIIFEQHVDEDKWIVNIDDEIVNVMKQSGSVAQTFYITEYNNPNVLIDTVLINLVEPKHIIEGNAKNRCSIFCKNIYNNYVHRKVNNERV